MKLFIVASMHKIMFLNIIVAIQAYQLHAGYLVVLVFRKHRLLFCNLLSYLIDINNYIARGVSFKTYKHINKLVYN